MTKRRFYWFAYPFAGREDRRLSAVHSRDGVAAVYQSSVFFDLGIRFQDLIVNYPAPKLDRPLAPEERRPLIPFDDGFLRDTDTLVLNTRVFLNDDDPLVPDAMAPAGRAEKVARKASLRSYTTLEEQVLRAVRPWVLYSSRTTTVVSDQAARISPAIAARQRIEFRQHGGPDYSQYGALDGKPRIFRQRPGLTAAYLVYVEHLWPGGPALLAIWGMAAEETLIWSRFLAHERPDLVGTTAFAMVEMKTVDHPDRAQIFFADKWPVTVLGTAPLAPQSPSPPSPDGNGVGGSVAA